MRICKILHPEVILGLRGSAFTFKLYDLLHKHITWTPEEGYKHAVERNEGWTASLEEDMLITWKYKQERPPIYHVPRDFLKAIAKIDKEIPVELLPDRFFAYFSFAENTIWDGSQWVQGMYVYIGPENETPLKPQYRTEGHKAFWAVYHTYPPPGRPPEDVFCARLLVDLEPKKFSEIISAAPKDFHTGDVEIPDQNVYLVGLNLAMYVNSIGCDLKDVRPIYKLKPAEKKDHIKRGEIINQCKLPVTVVSWNYKQERIYNVDSTWIDTFPRWQRCGPENSQVKLIWVNPFPRKYKNVKEKEDGK